MARRALWQEVYTDLRRKILTLELPPGAALAEAVIAQQMGLSATPVRDALGRLSQDRLVTSSLGRGYWVAPLVMSDLQQLAEFRFILERGVGELIVARKPDWTVITERSEQVRHAAGIHEQVDLNIEFHVALADATGNEHLAYTLRRVLEDSARFFRLGATESSAEDMADEHDILLQALRAGDLDAASRVYHREAFGTRDRVVKILLENPSAAASLNAGIVATS